MSDFGNNKKIIMLTASAGAGKTYTLAKTVVDVLQKKPSLGIENVLLITFTNKAVEEMEKTVFSMISEKAKLKSNYSGRWQEILRNFNRNSIMTFDSFFASIIREFGIFHGVDPQFTVVDLLKKKRIEKNIEKYLRGKLEKAIAERNDWLDVSSKSWLTSINALGKVNSLFEQAFTLAEDNERASKHREFVKKHFDSSPEQLWDVFQKNVFIPFVKIQLKTDIDDLRKLEAQMVNSIRGQFIGKSEITAQGVIKKIYSLITKSELNELSLLHVFLTEKFRKPTGKNADPGLIELFVQIQKIRLKYWESKIRPFYVAISQNEKPENWAFGQELLLNISLLADHINQLKLRLKIEASSLEFNDIRSLCHRLIHSSGSARIISRIKSKYQFVFIDEFQDSAPSQMEIMTKIFGLENHPLFFVGDEKQSIYRFRGAEVRLTGQMKKKLTALPKNTYGVESLEYNFRSFKDLIVCFNYVFSKVFEPVKVSPDYFSTYQNQKFPFEQISETMEQNNQPWEAAKLIHKLPSLKEPVHAYLNFFNYEKAQNIVPSILSEVKKILSSPQAPLFMNSITPYPLIGILLPTTKLFPLIEEAFDSNDIPYNMYTKGFYQTSEIIAMINLLKFWANPDNVFSLSALLRSELIGLSSESITSLLEERETFSLQAIEKIDPDLFSVLEKWKKWGKTLPLKDAIWKVIDYSPLNRTLMVDKHQREKIANIHKFIRELPDTPLNETIKLLDIMIRDVSEEKEILSDTKPVVVMTIHKSKGLKFQHVITLTPTNNHGNRGSKWMQIQMERDKEIKNYYFSAPIFYSPDSVAKKSANIFNTICTMNEREESIEELKRLSYVSHTRAVQGLTIFNQLPTQAEKSYPLNRKSPVHYLLWDVFNNNLNNDMNSGKVEFNNLEFLNIQSLSESEVCKPGPGTAPAPKVHHIYHQDLSAQPHKISIKINASHLFDLTNETHNRRHDKDPFPLDELSHDGAIFGQHFHSFMEKNIRSLLSNDAPFAQASDKVRKHVKTFIPDLRAKFQLATAFPEVEMAYKFNIKLQELECEVYLEGIADLLLYLPGKGYFIFDYKTGQKDISKHKIQLAVYRDLFSLIYNIQPAGCALIYSSPESSPPHIIYLENDPDFKDFDSFTWVKNYLHNDIKEIVELL